MTWKYLCPAFLLVATREHDRVYRCRTNNFTVRPTNVVGAVLDSAKGSCVNRAHGTLDKIAAPILYSLCQAKISR